MKYVLLIISFALLILSTASLVAYRQPPAPNLAALKGAWQMQNATDDHILIFTDTYFSNTRYNKATKAFITTFGGTYKADNREVSIKVEFHTSKKEQVGESILYAFTLSDDVLTITADGETTTWKQIDKGTAPLAGSWHITGRMQDGKLQSIHQSGGRKTVKILSGTRFQWAAINTDTKEFFGTGGGTYTFRNGQYTENIEFFSRDSSRVGASLSFNGKIESDGWHHSGLSSRGDKIYEVWNKTK